MFVGRRDGGVETWKECRSVKLGRYKVVCGRERGEGKQTNDDSNWCLFEYDLL